MQLVIAEKPSVAMSIAAVIGADERKEYPASDLHETVIRNGAALPIRSRDRFLFLRRRDLYGKGKDRQMRGL